LIAGHDAFGQGVLVEVGAQARHSVGEVAHVHAAERALFCPGQLFLTANHGSIYFASSAGRRGGALANHESRLSSPYLTLHRSWMLADFAFGQLASTCLSSGSLASPYFSISLL
jgi:hypothetical protein